MVEKEFCYAKLACFPLLYKNKHKRDFFTLVSNLCELSSYMMRFRSRMRTTTTTPGPSHTLYRDAVERHPITNMKVHRHHKKIIRPMQHTGPIKSVHPQSLKVWSPPYFSRLKLISTFLRFQKVQGLFWIKSFSHRRQSQILQKNIKKFHTKNTVLMGVPCRPNNPQ